MAQKSKSPLTPLYERGVNQLTSKLPPFLKGDGRGILKRGKSQMLSEVIEG
jgi:hypothetical protein